MITDEWTDKQTFVNIELLLRLTINSTMKQVGLHWSHAQSKRLVQGLVKDGVVEG